MRHRVGCVFDLARELRIATQYAVSLQRSPARRTEEVAISQ